MGVGGGEEEESHHAGLTVFFIKTNGYADAYCVCTYEASIILFLR